MTVMAKLLQTGQSVSEPAGAGCGCTHIPVMPGQAVVMSKWLGLAGTSVLVRNHREILAARLPEKLLREAEGFAAQISVSPEAEVAGDFGVSLMQEVSRGGLFAALWELAEKGGVGLEVSLTAIPIRQETIEICEALGDNPYELYGAGSLLMACPDGEGLAEKLREAGIPAAAIGRLTADKARVIVKGERRRFLNRPS